MKVVPLYVKYKRPCAWNIVQSKLFPFACSFQYLFRLVFSRFLDLLGNLGIAKEKLTGKTCFSHETKRLAPRIYQAKFCLVAFL